MVSLGNAGGQFFDQEFSQDAELLTDIGIASYEEEKRFKPIPTIGTLSVQLLLLIAYFALLYTIPIWYKPGIVSIEAALVYSHLALWCLLIMLERILYLQRRKFRIKGYLEFIWKTRIYSKVAIVVYSFGNMFLLILMGIFTDCSTVTNCGAFSKIHIVIYIKIIGTVETVIVILATVLHLVKTIRFNKMQAPPDVEQDELTSSFMQGHMPRNNIGFREDDQTDDILEKQADLICYLKQHNSMLGKKIVQLTTELRILKSR